MYKSHGPADVHRPKHLCIALLPGVSKHYVGLGLVSLTCTRRAQHVVPTVSAATHKSSLSSGPSHAELAADAYNCRRKRRPSQCSIYLHRSSHPLSPWRKSPVLSPYCFIQVTTYPQPRTLALLVHTSRRCTGQISHSPTW